MFVEGFIKLLGFGRNIIPSHKVQTCGMAQRAHFKSSYSIGKVLYILMLPYAMESLHVLRVSLGFLSNVALAIQIHPL